MATRPTTITGPNGQLMVWKPETTNEDLFNYLQQSSGFPTLDDAQRADFESDRGSYVPASNAFPKGKIPKWFLAAMILGPAAVYGGQALAGVGGAGAGTGATTGTVTGTSGTVGAGAGGAGTLGTLAKLGTLGQVLTNYSAGAGQGREREANLNLSTDALRQRQVEDERRNAIDRGTLEVNQRTTGQDLEDQARRQAAWGEYVRTAPRSIAPPPDKFKDRIGNLNLNIPGDYSTLANQSYDAAMKRLLSGSDKQFTPQPNIPTPPVTPQPNESTTDRLLRLAGLFSGVAGSFSNYRPPTGRT